MQFHRDAIILSGETGTKLKCDVLSHYYPIWRNITSGGPARRNILSNAIVEMNAGTGLDYIEDIDKEILGSSGHALQLKLENEDSASLKVILVEEDHSCFEHLLNVISAKWPNLDLQNAKGPPEKNTCGVFLFEAKPSNALDMIQKISLRNSLFFFDPLLYTPWTEIEQIAARRIIFYYKTGTEFLIFLFTSDWFYGRKKIGLDPLPTSTIPGDWKESETQTVKKMDDLFGSSFWRNELLNKEVTESKMQKLVSMYQSRLHKWFRYILPLPFNPKGSQLYHIFVCSNYAAGIQIPRRFYSKFTGNPWDSFDADLIYEKFNILHPETRTGLTGRHRPVQWKLLRVILKEHQDGLCDESCQDLAEIEPNSDLRRFRLKWLESNGYLRQIKSLTDAWYNLPQMYEVNWDVIKSKLGVEKPRPFEPLRPSQKESPET